MNDRLIPAEKPATDRHPYRRVKDIVGRAEGGDLVFRRPDGREERITSFAFGSLSWKHVERIQFHVGNDACRLDLVPEPGLGASPRRGGGRRRGSEAPRPLRQPRAPSCPDLGPRAVDSIEPDPATGKVRAVVTIPQSPPRTSSIRPDSGPPESDRNTRSTSPESGNRSEKPAAQSAFKSRCGR